LRVANCQRGMIFPHGYELPSYVTGEHMNANFENLNLQDSLKEMKERNRFIDVLIKEQEGYSTDSLEGQSFKLAVAAIAFSITLHVECLDKLLPLSESQRKRMAETKRLLDQEYKDNFSREKGVEDDISLKEAPNMLACLKELLEKHDKSTEAFAALQCSLKDIEMAMSQEKRFSIFLKNV
jgi:hypothetical protein